MLQTNYKDITYYLNMNDILENPNPKIYPKLADRPDTESLKNKNPEEFNARDIFGNFFNFISR